MKEIKTVADVQATPETEFIMMADNAKAACLFCGKELPYEFIGFGRNKCKQLLPCSCEVARAARKHNELKRRLDEEAWENKRLEELKARDKRLQDEAKKPVTITAEQMFCVISGRVLPGVEPVEAEDVVGAAMRHAGFTNGSGKEKLEAYAESQGFSNALKDASAELLEFVVRSGADWKTDISGKVSQLCEAYKLPKTIVM